MRSKLFPASHFALSPRPELNVYEISNTSLWNVAFGWNLLARLPVWIFFRVNRTRRSNRNLSFVARNRVFLHYLVRLAVSPRQTLKLKGNSANERTFSCHTMSQSQSTKGLKFYDVLCCDFISFMLIWRKAQKLFDRISQKHSSAVYLRVHPMVIHKPRNFSPFRLSSSVSLFLFDR